MYEILNNVTFELVLYEVNSVRTMARGQNQRRRMQYTCLLFLISHARRTFVVPQWAQNSSGPIMCGSSMSFEVSTR